MTDFVCLDRGTEMGDGLLGLTAFGESTCQVIVGFPVFRIAFYGYPEMFYRRLFLAASRKGGSKVVVGNPSIRVLFEVVREESFAVLV